MAVTLPRYPKNLRPSCSSPLAPLVGHSSLHAPWDEGPQANMIDDLAPLGLVQIAALPEFRSRMATAGLNANLNLRGDKFLQKMGQEGLRWAGIVKATGFVAD